MDTNYYYKHEVKELKLVQLCISPGILIPPKVALGVSAKFKINLKKFIFHFLLNMVRKLIFFLHSGPLLYSQNYKLRLCRGLYSYLLYFLIKGKIINKLLKPPSAKFDWNNRSNKMRHNSLVEPSRKRWGGTFTKTVTISTSHFMTIFSTHCSHIGLRHPIKWADCQYGNYSDPIGYRLE